MSNRENTIPVFRDTSNENVTNSKAAELKNVLKEAKVNENAVSPNPSNSLKKNAKLEKVQKEIPKTKEERKAKPVKHIEQVTASTRKIEQVRKSTPPQKEEKPLLLVEEKETHVNIHHKEQKEKELAVDPKDLSLMQDLKAKLASLTEERDTKEAHVLKLRQELSNKRKEIRKYDQDIAKVKDIQSQILKMKAEYEDQEEAYSELNGIMNGLNETGLSFLRKYEEKEQEINSLLNILSETKYKIQEIS